MLEETVHELLKQFGIKYNKNRAEILKIILENVYTTSTIDIISKLKHIDKTTIYRILHLFEDKKLLLKDIDPKGITHYCINKSYKNHHIHFSCKICTKTYCKEIDNQLKLNIVEAGFIDTMEIKITGVCKNCLTQPKGF
ncbi:MAG: transcriptional repressor [Calditerrivibrio sp.]|nr:transcriptional repressor [Calditerrivibrio sp.]